MEYRIVVMTSNVSRARRERVTEPPALLAAQKCPECKVMHSVGQPSQGFIVRGAHKGKYALDTPHYYDITPCEEHADAVIATADFSYDK